jgi:hypothetical protein
MSTMDTSSLSAGDRRRLNRVLTFQKRGEEKRRATAAAECAASAAERTASALRTELHTLPRSQLRKRALQSGISQQRIDEVEDSSDNPYAMFIDLLIENELQSTNVVTELHGGARDAQQDDQPVSEQRSALRLEPVTVPPRSTLSHGGSPGSDRFTTSPGSTTNVSLSSAEVQELCESIAAELGSFRHMCKEDTITKWLESERRLLRILRQRLQSHELSSIDCSPSP